MSSNTWGRPQVAPVNGGRPGVSGLLAVAELALSTSIPGAAR